MSVKAVISGGVVWPAAELEGSLVMAAVLIPGSQLEKRIGKAAAGRLVGRLVAFAEMLRAFGTGVEEEIGPDSEPDYEPDFAFDPAERSERLRREWDAKNAGRKKGKSRD